MKAEKGLKLGISIILVLVIAVAISFWIGFESGMHKGLPSVVNGMGMQLIGILFLLSYFYSHKIFVFRYLIWTCEHFSFPRSRKMAFFYFLMFFGLGTIALLKGLGLFASGADPHSQNDIPVGVESFEAWWYKDPLLYIVILIVIVAIVYRYKKGT